MDNLELIILTIAIVLIFIGTIKIRLSVKSRNTFLMFLAAILFLVIGAIYIGAWMISTFYYGPYDSPLFLSYILFSAEPITDLIFLIGAIGFYGLSNSYAQSG